MSTQRHHHGVTGAGDYLAVETDVTGAARATLSAVNHERALVVVLAGPTREPEPGKAAPALRAAADLDGLQRARKWSGVTSLAAPDPDPVPSRVDVAPAAPLSELEAMRGELADVKAMVGRLVAGLGGVS